MPLSNYKQPRCTLSALMIIYWQTTVAAQSLCSLWSASVLRRWILRLMRWPLVSGGPGSLHLTLKDSQRLSNINSLSQKWTIKCDHLMVVKNVQISKQKWQLKNTPFGLAEAKACEAKQARKRFEEGMWGIRGNHAKKPCKAYKRHANPKCTREASGALQVRFVATGIGLESKL